jgi:DNA polymerase-1
MSEYSVSYETDIPQMREKKDWQSLFNFILVENIDQLRQIFEDWKKLNCPITAFDTETTHLSFIDLKLVGFSFCFDKKNAYYIPVGHLVGNNLPFWESLSILKEMVCKAEKSLFYNASFDLRVLRKYGFDALDVRMLDVMALVWNVDTNIKMPSLKKSAKYHLGFTMITFKELMGKVQETNFRLVGEDDDRKENISFLDPAYVRDYAAADALCTYFLFLRWLNFYKENQFIVDLDSEFERTLMFLEETPINIDLKKVELMMQVGKKKQDDIQKRIYEAVGKTFDITSSKQLGTLLESKKLPVKKNPSTKNYMLDEKAIAILKLKHEKRKVSDTCTYGELLDLVLYFRKIKKEDNTYLVNFKEQSFKDEEKAYGFFHYLTHRNPTGRLQGTGEKPRPGESRVFFGIQSQNITKPKSAFFKPVENKSGAVLGWDFELVEKEEEGTIEGFRPNNLREIILPYPDHYILSIDYSGQEIVMAGNLSGDRAFLDPLKAGKDAHKEVALKMFGKENYDKEKRKIAKAANFGCLYLGTEYALSKSLPEKPLRDLKEHVKLWKEVHKDYFAHLERMYSFARKHGYVKSKLGRMRRVAYWFNSHDGSQVFFGKKTVANSPNQGLGGDIIRYVLIRILQEVLLDKKYDGKIYFSITVHDEINFSITKDPKYFYEIANKILAIMVDLPFKDWEVPLTVSPSVGRTWGELFPFIVKSKDTWIPDIG